MNHFEYTGIFRGVLDHYTRKILEKGMELENKNLQEFLEY